MTDIANRVGLIYKIVCNDINISDCYVGSCQAFRARKYKHKSACFNSNDIGYNYNVYRFIRENGGWDNWSMLQIETIMFREKRELLTKERHWIETLKATLNSQIPVRTKLEYYEDNKEYLLEKMKEYQENNREQIKEKMKEYREANKEQIIERKKEYYEDNKTIINEKKNQIITCDCGKSSTKNNISQHKKSKNHKQFEKYYNFIVCL